MSDNKIKKREDSSIGQVFPVISAESFDRCPGTVNEMINTYGTYNIQPTSDTDNIFPAIAQGATPDMERRDKKFYRNGDDFNPASDWSDSDCAE